MKLNIFLNIPSLVKGTVGNKIKEVRPFNLTSNITSIKHQVITQSIPFYLYSVPLLKDLKGEEIIIIQPLPMQSKVINSDIIGVFKDMLNSYQEFLLTLNLEQKIALCNLWSDIFIFACLVTITSIFYGDLMIKYFNLEERFPKIAKLIQLRRKFKTYSLTLNIALIFVMLIFVMLYNLYFIFFLYK